MAGSDNNTRRPSAPKKKSFGPWSLNYVCWCVPHRQHPKKRASDHDRWIMFADVCPAPIAVGSDHCIKVLNKKSGKYYTSKWVVLNDADKTAIIRTAWKECSSHLVKNYKPRYVLVLGRSVLSAIGAYTIQESHTSHGGLLLGSMYHPSCNYAKSEACSRVMMQYLRQVVFAACSSPDESARFPNID